MESHAKILQIHLRLLAKELDKFIIVTSTQHLLREIGDVDTQDCSGIADEFSKPNGLRRHDNNRIP